MECGDSGRLITQMSRPFLLCRALELAAIAPNGLPNAFACVA